MTAPPFPASVRPGNPGAWARFVHMTLQHGMLAVPCPDCTNNAPDCPTCDGCSIVWTFTDRRACGPDCPLAKNEN